MKSPKTDRLYAYYAIRRLDICDKIWLAVNFKIVGPVGIVWFR